MADLTLIAHPLHIDLTAMGESPEGGESPELQVAVEIRLNSRQSKIALRAQEIWIERSDWDAFGAGLHQLTLGEATEATLRSSRYDRDSSLLIQVSETRFQVEATLWVPAAEPIRFAYGVEIDREDLTRLLAAFAGFAKWW